MLPLNLFMRTIVDKRNGYPGYKEIRIPWRMGLLVLAAIIGGIIALAVLL